MDLEVSDILFFPELAVGGSPQTYLIKIDQGKK
jgi:hypothetical protein